MTKGKKVIAIGYSLSTITRLDQIIVPEKRSVVESATNTEPLKKMVNAPGFKTNNLAALLILRQMNDTVELD